MNTNTVEKAAKALSESRLKNRKIGSLNEEIRPMAEKDAYEVQDKLHEIIEKSTGDKVVGHKIGCTTPVMQKFLSIDNPCAGAVFKSTVHKGNGVFTFDNLLHPGVECELAVYLKKDLPDTNESYDADSVIDAIESVMPAIEVVDDRWNNYKLIDTPTLIADDFFGAGCVLGPPFKDICDLDKTRGSMWINGNIIGSGTGGDIMGDPLSALAWLANSMITRGKQLNSGEFVLLGSLVQTEWVNKGDIVDIELEGQGKARAIFN